MRGPTAWHQAHEAVWYIIGFAGLAPIRRSRVTSNVRRRILSSAMSSNALLLCVVTLAIAILGSPVSAQVRLNPYAAPPLSGAELRECAQKDQDLSRLESALREAIRMHTNDAVELESSARGLEELRARTDPADQEAINLFNRRNADRNALVAAHNLRAGDLERHDSEVRNARAAHRRACGGRPFATRDRPATIHESGAANSQPRP